MAPLCAGRGPWPGPAPGRQFFAWSCMSGAQSTGYWRSAMRLRATLLLEAALGVTLTGAGGSRPRLTRGCTKP